MSKDLIDRDGSVIVVDEDGESYNISVEEEELVWSRQVPEEIYEWALENSEYGDFRKEADDLDWPIRVTQGHHLEDSLGLKIPRELDELLGYSGGYELFQNEMGGRPDYPSISVTEHWDVHDDGRVELAFVEYDGVRYTPE